jgi:hypothetical protein
MDRNLRRLLNLLSLAAALLLAANARSPGGASAAIDWHSLAVAFSCPYRMLPACVEPLPGP